LNTAVLPITTLVSPFHKLAHSTLTILTATLTSKKYMVSYQPKTHLSNITKNPISSMAAGIAINSTAADSFICPPLCPHMSWLLWMKTGEESGRDDKKE
jgi:hypothetical protein